MWQTVNKQNISLTSILMFPELINISEKFGFMYGAKSNQCNKRVDRGSSRKTLMNEEDTSQIRLNKFKVEH